ncbi:MAG: geranylgeranyl reductase [Robiginitomaculum sp.]|nr:MAG: geranylgeranyl reductase [Robiginitomaculum sp.]
MILTPDIYVIGLGPGGACAAYEAAKNSFLTIGVERKKIPGTPVQCAEFIPALMGNMVNNLRATCVQNITSMHTQVESSPADIIADFPGRMIDRAAFDTALAQEAQNAGVQCHYGQSVRHINHDGAISLANGTKIKPKVIIGADGPHSLAGKAIGSINNEILETRQISIPLLKPFKSTDIFLKADIRGGYAWLFPKGKTANLGVGIVASDKARLKPILDTIHKSLVDEGRVGAKTLSHTGGAIPAGGMVMPHGMLGETLVLLIGDAAGLTNPVTGAGINAAVISGRLAGEAAADWLQGDDDAPKHYHEDLTDLFGASLRRALDRRRALLQNYDNNNTPTPDDLRASWIAYSEYWAA